MNTTTARAAAIAVIITACLLGGCKSPYEKYADEFCACNSDNECTKKVNQKYDSIQMKDPSDMDKLSKDDAKAVLKMMSGCK